MHGHIFSFVRWVIGMHIRFVFPDIDPSQYEVVHKRSPSLHLGIGYISSVLKQAGHKTSLHHIYEPISKQEFLESLAEEDPDIVAFSSTSNQFQYVKALSKWAKETDVPTLVGGVHATLAPEEVITLPSVDFICIGEGEYPTLELANAIQKGESTLNVMNIWSKKDGAIIKNEIRPLLSNLDGLPFPDRELFDYGRLLENNGYRFDMMAGRGCPFDCTYCCNHAFRKAYNGKGKYIRIRSVRNVLEEIEEAHKRYNFRHVDFHDDLFTLFPEWIEEFCTQYPRHINCRFGCNARPETLTKPMVKALRSAGCDQIAIGIESGNEWLRKNVLKRTTTNEQIINAFRNTSEQGIKTFALNVIGFPYETPEMIEDTIRINKIVSPDGFQLSIFYPYPQTELWSLCKREHFLTDEERPSFLGDSVLQLPTLSREQIRMYYEKFEGEILEENIETHFPRTAPVYSIFKFMFGQRTGIKLFQKFRYVINRSRAALHLS
jgi:radical SAM superfamily enzyme YgiQ (UPF0313 family)